MAKLRRWVVLPGLLVLLVALGAGCVAPSAATDLSGRELRITTTTNFITDLARAIGGDRVEVTGLMGPGVDPHLYRASADDVRTLRDADVILYGGLHLEGKMADLFGDLAERTTTKAVTDDVDRGLLLAPGAAMAGMEYDPHVWFDVSIWMRAARTVADTLVAADQANAGFYRRNLDAYLAELADLDAYVTREIATIPPARRVLVTSHDAFSYFGRRYGIEVAPIQGISTVAEATTGDVERIAELVTRRGVPAVFVESSVPHQTIDALVAAVRHRGGSVRVGGELFTDAAGQDGSYVGMVTANVDRIVAALEG